MNEITEAVKRALEEDVKQGDITTIAVIPPSIKAKGQFLVKQDGYIAGFEIVQTVFSNVDPDLRFNTFLNDGDKVSKGDIIASVLGSASSILIGERTALNFMQRMSGIATTSRAYADKVKHTKAKVIDTRKTVPGLRIIDKLAVKMGGCENHRIGLYDMFLIKDNHIAVAGSLTKAVEACKEFNRKKQTTFKIEVETDSLEQVREAVNSGADIIMLDNFDVDEMKEAVQIINGRCKIEASGGISIDTVKEIAETGVDFISVGALTHSVKSLDISLEITLI